MNRLSAGDEAQFEQFLRTHALARPNETARWHALTGGISSEIWRVDLPGRSLCVKRALPQLKVADHWQAPLSRNDYEWRWLRFAAQHQPQAVPQPLAHDVAAGLFAMSYLPPEQYPVWKAQLLGGVVSPQVAAQVGTILARLHQASAARPELAAEFDSLANFHALRIEPYFLTTAARHPDVGEQLRATAARTEGIAIALVHGDMSPKNILVGPQGPVFLDAECAWYGDPAFDLAFCLNHLLLKTWVRPDCAPALFDSYSTMIRAYFESVEFEPRPQLEMRVAQLLPALMLARIDGKSPVEYLAGKAREQELLRRISRALIVSPVTNLTAIVERFVNTTKTQ